MDSSVRALRPGGADHQLRVEIGKVGFQIEEQEQGKGSILTSGCGARGSISSI